MQVGDHALRVDRLVAVLADDHRATQRLVADVASPCRLQARSRCSRSRVWAHNPWEGEYGSCHPAASRCEVCAGSLSQQPHTRVPFALRFGFTSVTQIVLICHLTRANLRSLYSFSSLGPGRDRGPGQSSRRAKMASHGKGLQCSLCLPVCTCRVPWLRRLSVSLTSAPVRLVPAALMVSRPIHFYTPRFVQNRCAT